MKFLLVLAFSLPSLAAIAPEGKFSFAHQIGFMSYRTQAACEADKGKWEGDEDGGLCFMDASDDVSVTKAADGKLTVSVSTVTTNAHMCDFEGAAEQKSADELIARADTEEYVPGENGKEGTFKPAVCELSVKYLDSNTLSVSLVSPRSKCESFCGMNAGLEIEKAVRK